jgi:hypothetical protein
MEHPDILSVIFDHLLQTPARLLCQQIMAHGDVYLHRGRRRCVVAILIDYFSLQTVCSMWRRNLKTLVFDWPIIVTHLHTDYRFIAYLEDPSTIQLRSLAVATVQTRYRIPALMDSFAREHNIVVRAKGRRLFSDTILRRIKIPVNETRRFFRGLVDARAKNSKRMDRIYRSLYKTRTLSFCALNG